MYFEVSMISKIYNIIILLLYLNSWIISLKLRNEINFINEKYCLTGGFFAVIAVFMQTKKKIKKSEPTDWHPYDITAGIWKRGWTLRKLAIQNGYSAGSIRKVLRKPWPKAEKILADILGLPPWAIWPSRYNHLGKPNRGGPGRKPKLRVVKK
jgi:Ner family transcriptional regulator